MLRRFALLAALALMAVPSFSQTTPKGGECNDDAMFVFDASGSMSGTDWSAMEPRIAKVRRALAEAMPQISAGRNLGLMSYGPGPYNVCDNIRLHFEPMPDTGPRIVGEVDALIPAGRTPLTEATRQAALILSRGTRTAPPKPSVIVLLTDGGETCSGQPCQLSKILKREQPQIRVHVVGFRLRDEQGVLGYFAARCLADDTGGMFLSTETTEELVAALKQTFGCPALSQQHHGTAQRQG